MKANPGDKIIIKGHRIHEPVRNAEILEVRGEDGQPPYLVRWSETGRTTLFFPGADAFLEAAHDKSRR